MQEGSPYIDVGLLSSHKQQCRKAVYHDTHSCRPRHSHSVYLLRLAYLVDTLNNDGSHGNKQYDGVEQGNEHRALLIAIGVCLIAHHTRKSETYGYKHQREHIAEIVTRIRQQAQRVVYEPHYRLHRHEQQVQDYGEYEYSVYRRKAMRMTVMMVM